MLTHQIERLVQVYQNAPTIKTGKYYTTINEFTDQIPAMRCDTLLAAATSLIDLGPISGNKILCEEDKGAALGGVVSVLTSLSLAMARWYPYKLPTSIEVPMKMEYFEGSLYVNGVEENDELILVDDTLSTGGTLIALADAIKKAKAHILEIRVVVEKIGNGGRDRIKQELGIDVKSVIGISIDSKGQTHLAEVLGQPVG